MCNIKEFKGNKIWYEENDTNKQSLIFNWVMFLGGFSKFKQ